MDYRKNWAFNIEKNSLSSVYPWLIAAYLEALDDPNSEYYEYRYVIADTQPLDWVDELGQPIKFLSYPLSLGGIGMSSDSSLPSVSLLTFNSPVLVNLIEDNNGFIGTRVTIFIINANTLKDNDENQVTMAEYPLKFSFVIVDCKIKDYITFTLGAPNFLAYKIPNQRFYRDFCPIPFQGEHCWMKNFTPKPGHEHCSKSWKDCQKHWEEQHADQPDDPEYPTRGLRFQGFPNLNKGSFVYY